MPFITISSSDNAAIKAISKLKQKKYRLRERKYITEGLRAVSELIKSGKDACFVATERFLNDNPDVASALKDYKCYVVTEKIFGTLSETETPQGLLCTADIPTPPAELLKDYYIYLDKLTDPGNIGTIIRTAHAFGFGGVLLSPECCDAYSGKVIRSTMSSVLFTDIYTDFSHASLKKLKKNGYKIISAALYKESRSLYTLSIPEKAVFVIGNEANGVSDEVLSFSDETVIIPMPGGAESLNASVAAAIVMNEAVREKKR